MVANERILTSVDEEDGSREMNRRLSASRPGSAYVIGHHPYSMMVIEEVWWDNLVTRYPFNDEQCESISKELCQLDEAVKTQSQVEHLDTGALVSFQQARNRFEETCWRFTDHPELIHEAKDGSPCYPTTVPLKVE